MTYFGMRCRFGKDEAFSAACVFLSSLRDLAPFVGGIPRTYVLGCNMPPLRGWGLPARSAVSDKCEFSGRALIRERRIRCLRIVISVTSFLQWPVPQSFSREAATECSPGRKPWVKAESGASPKGRKKRGPDLRLSRCAPDLQHQTT